MREGPGEATLCPDSGLRITQSPNQDPLIAKNTFAATLPPKSQLDWDVVTKVNQHSVSLQALPPSCQSISVKSEGTEAQCHVVTLSSRRSSLSF